MVYRLLMAHRKLLSIVVPALNEEANLRAVHQSIVETMAVLPCDFEIVFIDDGSSDGTLQVGRDLNAADARVRMISFSRNFGTQMGILAGLEHARGDAVVVMDADLQHPPALIKTMFARWQEGSEVVYTIRQDTEDAGFVKRTTSSMFAGVFNHLAKPRIDPQGCDFRLLDRKVVDAIVSMREHRRFFRGLATWVGFRQIGIPYVAAARAAGTTKYNYRRLASLALDAITSFSTVPLRLCGWIGLFAAVGVLPYALWAIYVRLFSDQYVPGWSAIIVSILFLGGVQLISLAVLGEYVGRVYDEVKGRPHYIVREYVGDDSCSVGRSGAIPLGANSKGTAPPGESLERTHS